MDQAPLAHGALARITGVVNFHVDLPNGTGTMRFESEGRTIETPISQNRFVVDLPQGTWSQRSLDGRICDLPVVVGDQPGPNYLLGGTGFFTGVQYEGRFEGCTPLAPRP